MLPRSSRGRSSYEGSSASRGSRSRHGQRGSVHSSRSNGNSIDVENGNSWNTTPSAGYENYLRMMESQQMWSRSVDLPLYSAHSSSPPTCFFEPCSGIGLPDFSSVAANEVQFEERVGLGSRRISQRHEDSTELRRSVRPRVNHQNERTDPGQSTRRHRNRSSSSAVCADGGHSSGNSIASLRTHPSSASTDAAHTSATNNEPASHRPPDRIRPISVGRVSIGGLSGIFLTHLFRRARELRLMSQGNPPASEFAVQNLVSMSSDDAPEGDICAICQDDLVISAGTPGKKMPCQHGFHESCLIPWLQQHNTCPVCRCQIESSCPHYNRLNREKLQGPVREEAIAPEESEAGAPCSSSSSGPTAMLRRVGPALRSALAAAAAAATASGSSAVGTERPRHRGEVVRIWTMDGPLELSSSPSPPPASTSAVQASGELARSASPSPPSESPTAGASTGPGFEEGGRSMAPLIFRTRLESASPASFSARSGSSAGLCNPWPLSTAPLSATLLAPPPRRVSTPLAAVGHWPPSLGGEWAFVAERERQAREAAASAVQSRCREGPLGWFSPTASSGPGFSLANATTTASAAMSLSSASPPSPETRDPGFGGLQDFSFPPLPSNLPFLSSVGIWPECSPLQSSSATSASRGGPSWYPSLLAQAASTTPGAGTTPLAFQSITPLSSASDAQVWGSQPSVSGSASAIAAGQVSSGGLFLGSHSLPSLLPPYRGVDAAVGSASARLASLGGSVWDRATPVLAAPAPVLGSDAGLGRETWLDLQAQEPLAADAALLRRLCAREPAPHPTSFPPPLSTATDRQTGAFDWSMVLGSDSRGQLPSPPSHTLGGGSL